MAAPRPQPYRSKDRVAQRTNEARSARSGGGGSGFFQRRHGGLTIRVRGVECTITAPWLPEPMIWQCHNGNPQRAAVAMAERLEQERRP